MRGTHAIQGASKKHAASATTASALPQSWAAGQTLGICLALLLIPLVWHRPYFDSLHAEDDLDHLLKLADYRLGVVSIVEYAMAPINEHLLPLWRLWYLLCWQVFGLDTTGWHASVAIAHGLGAACLFVVLRSALGQMLPAAFAAGLWAIAGVAGWDSPLSWLPASHLTFGITGLLGAMACTTHYRSSRAWAWPVAMAACMTLAVAWMSAMWVLMPVIAAQWLLLIRTPGESWLPKRRWLVVWLVTFVLLGAVAVAGATGMFLDQPSQPTGSDPVAGLLRAAASWELTAENLIARDVRQPAVAHLATRAVGGLVLMLAAMFLAGAQHRVVVLVLGMVIVYGVLVQAARSYLPAEYGLNAGRYAYLPTLGWCTVLGAWLANPALRRNRQLALLAGAVIAVTLPWLVFQQYRNTQTVAQATRDAIAPSQFAFAGAVDVFGDLAKAGQRRRQDVRLPDISWFQRPTTYNLRRLRAVAFPHGLPGIAIISSDEWSDEDCADVNHLLGQSQNTMRWTLEDCLLMQRKVATALLAIEAAAKSLPEPLVLPDKQLELRVAYFKGHSKPHPPRDHDPDWVRVPYHASLSVFSRSLFPSGLSHLRLVPETAITATQRVESIEVLRKVAHPFAQQLGEALAAGSVPPTPTTSPTN